MKHHIPVTRISGQSSRQAHADLPEGTYEREMSKDGFFGPATFFYHRHPPTGWSSFEGALRPHAYDLNRDQRAADSPWDAPLLLGNAATKLRWWQLRGSMDHLARNADGDELMFVHEGSAELYCDFGHLSLAAGDYVVIPRGTMWRLATKGFVRALLIEATNSGYGLPDRGLAGRHAVFDPAILDVPAIDQDFLAQQSDQAWRVLIKHRGSVSTVTFPYNPLDAVGWHGDLSVCRLNVRDIRPLMSHRYHLPPCAHTTFIADRFVVCTFVPRPFETDPGALKVPFFHNNDDYDEVIFYHAGQLFLPRPHRPRNGYLSPGGVHARPASEGFVAHACADRTGHRRVRGDDRYARCARCRRLRKERRARRVRRQLEATSRRQAVKLASLAGGRDGRLVVVNRTLTQCVSAAPIATCLQDALDNWQRCEARLKDLSVALEAHQAKGVEDFAAAQCVAPLPRAYAWIDGSAYVNHVELVRKARGAQMPDSFWTDPLIYQGGSDDLLGAMADVPFGSTDWGIDLEAEVAVITGDVPMLSTAEDVRKRADIRLLVLVNDWTLRNLVPGELAKGFGFFQAKPATGFSPVAVTPDELGGAWDGAKLHRPLESYVNGERLGAPDAGTDMTFDFPTLIAHAAHTRNLRAGTIVGSGTVSNIDRSRGSSCLAERRMLEVIGDGVARTPFLNFGDRVRIEMLDEHGASHIRRDRAARLPRPPKLGARLRGGRISFKLGRLGILRDLRAGCPAKPRAGASQSLRPTPHDAAGGTDRACLVATRQTCPSTL